MINDMHDLRKETINVFVSVHAWVGSRIVESMLQPKLTLVAALHLKVHRCMSICTQNPFYMKMGCYEYFKIALG